MLSTGNKEVAEEGKGMTQVSGRKTGCQDYDCDNARITVEKLMTGQGSVGDEERQNYKIHLDTCSDPDCAKAYRQYRASLGGRVKCEVALKIYNEAMAAGDITDEALEMLSAHGEVCSQCRPLSERIKVDRTIHSLVYQLKG